MFRHGVRVSCPFLLSRLSLIPSFRCFSLIPCQVHVTASPSSSSVAVPLSPPPSPSLILSLSADDRWMEQRGACEPTQATDGRPTVLHERTDGETDTAPLPNSHFTLCIHTYRNISKGLKTSAIIIGCCCTVREWQNCR